MLAAWPASHRHRKPVDSARIIDTVLSPEFAATTLLFDSVHFALAHLVSHLGKF